MNDIFDVAKTWREVVRYMSDCEPWEDNNELIQEDIDKISWKVEKILISEEWVIFSVRKKILDNLDIENESIRTKIMHLLGKYINQKTEFYYDRESEKVLWWYLSENELKQFTSELYKLYIQDKYLLERLNYSERKQSRLWNIRKLETQVAEYKKELEIIELELFQKKSALARLEDKQLRVDYSALEDENTALEVKKIKVKENIENILKEIEENEIIVNILNKVLNSLDEKEKAGEIDMDFIDLISKSEFSYKAKEEKEENKREFSLSLWKNWKRLVFTLAFLAGLGVLVKGIHENNKSNLIMQQYSTSLNNTQLIEQKIERDRVEKLANVFPKQVEGFEKYKVTNIKKWIYDLVYKWDTTDMYVYVLEINIYYIKNWKKTIDNRWFYFYKKDLNNNEYCMLIKTVNDKIWIVGNLDIK